MISDHGAEKLINDLTREVDDLRLELKAKVRSLRDGLSMAHDSINLGERVFLGSVGSRGSIIDGLGEKLELAERILKELKAYRDSAARDGLTTAKPQSAECDANKGL